MAVNDLKDFSSQGLVGGLLMICLLTFAISFMAANNGDGFGSDVDSVLGGVDAQLETRLLESPSDSDTLLNITANTNPEAGDLGSRDSVATSYEAVGSTRRYYEAAKDLIGWVFTGETGKMLLAVIGALIGFLALFFTVKFIRQGS